MRSVFETEKNWAQFSGLEFWGRDFEKIEGKNQKNFKDPKMPKIVPKSVQTSFEHVLRQFFRNVFYPLFHRGSGLQLLLNWTPNKGNSIGTKVGKKLKHRRPALHAIILHCGTKSAMIAYPKLLTDIYTGFLPKAQPYLNSMTRTPKSKPCIITLPKNKPP